MQVTSFAQGKVSNIPTVHSWGGSIGPGGFLPSILLLVVIVVAVVIVVVAVILVVVVVSSIVKLSFVITGWANEFHLDKASSVRVLVANFTLQSSVQLLRENTDSVRSNQRMSPTAPSAPLKLKGSNYGNNTGDGGGAIGAGGGGIGPTDPQMDPLKCQKKCFPVKLRNSLVKPRIPLLYRGKYSQWVERFMNYLEEQTNGEAMINSIKNGDQPLPCVTQMSIARTTSAEQPPLKDKSMWSDQEKRVQKIDRLARSLLIQGLPNDIYSLIDSNKTTKDLWDALARHMLGFEYGEQDRKAVVLYEYETFKAIKGELLLDTYIQYLQVINDLKKCGYSKDNYVNDAIGSKKKTVVVTSDPLALIAEKINVSRSKEKAVVSSDSEGS
nr:hypothetical protein [Tanacetum cinerariifolium]